MGVWRSFKEHLPMSIRQPLYRIKYRLKVMFDPDTNFLDRSWDGKYLDVPDDAFLKRLFRLKMGKELDLENPKTYCEKLQWLKLYDRNPEYTRMVDKIEAKRFVTERAGEGHVIPMYGAWDSFDEIDFDSLPDRFVLKCNHDSYGVIVCEDKKTFDYAGTKKIIDKRLKRNNYWPTREWPYKNVKPRVFAEQYIDTIGKRDSVEYKLTCFDGRAKLITVCGGIPHAEIEDRTNDHYDRDFNRLEFTAFYGPAKPPLPLPDEIEEIIAFSEKLAEGIPEVRVDSYLIDGKVMFGEMTFYTWAGLIPFDPPEYDEILGSWINLPETKRTGETETERTA